MKAITEFRGRYRFLSNFYPSAVEYKGIVYPTSEHAYQAQKTGSVKIKHLIAHMEWPAQAKAKGRSVKTRDDWDDVKVEIMKDILNVKFAFGTDMHRWLADTAPATLIEGNWWHDNFWGDCYCEQCIEKRGRNTLGKLLMEVRDGK